MSFIHNLISAIATPIRQIYYWCMQLVPGLRAISNSSLPLRMSLMTLVFLLIIWLAAFIKRIINENEIAKNNTFGWIMGALLGVIVIPPIVYYLTKYLMMREESKFPEIDRIWFEALEECERLGIDLAKVPLFLILGSPNIRFGGHLLKLSDFNPSVTVPRQGDGDIAVYANADALFLVLSGCSCLSRLAAMPRETIQVNQAIAPAPAALGDGGRTIDPAFFAAAGGAGGFGEEQLAATKRDRGFADAAPGATLLLPDDQDFSELLRGDEGTTIVKSKQLASSDIADCEERLQHVCGLVRNSRGPLCPINGILTSVPFETIDSSSAQLQVAAQKDLAVLRNQLMIRCGNTVLVTDMEMEEGFQELINRFGPQRSRDYRFGKGCELWSPPEYERLAAIGSHATGAFEDWIYMLFQDEAALKRRYNSRLFRLLCTMRGAFSKSLSEFLSRGFGYDPQTAPHLAHEQFLFGGCYFAATGHDPSRQAFVRSVIQKLIEQDGELEWAPAARRIDSQYQFAANLAVLIGTAALISIAVMLMLFFNKTP